MLRLAQFRGAFAIWFDYARFVKVARQFAQFVVYSGCVSSNSPICPGLQSQTRLATLDLPRTRFLCVQRLQPLCLLRNERAQVREALTGIVSCGSQRLCSDASTLCSLDFEANLRAASSLWRALRCKYVVCTWVFLCDRIRRLCLTR
jgi:hypothetical protein